VLIWRDCGAATGVGGSGFCISELSVRLIAGGEGACAGSVAAKLSKDTVCGCLGATSFPCRCLGAGGGFFLPFFTSDTSPILSSSSDPAISTDVRGESACVSCGGSNSDCREIDEVSVLLLVSNCAPASGCDTLVGCGGGPDGRGVGFPVMSRFLKLSTSKDALLLPNIGLPVFVRPRRSPFLAVLVTPAFSKTDSPVRCSAAGSLEGGSRMDLDLGARLLLPWRLSQ